MFFFLCVIRGTVYCSTPSFHLEEFSGALDIAGMQIKRQPVDDSNLAIRGTILRNTSWIVGLVCYTGFKTKLALNSSSPPTKYSALNRMVDLMVVSIVLVQVIFCVVAGALATAWQADQNNIASTYYAYYLYSFEAPGTTGVKAFFSYFILLSYVIPQTLMISLEISKLLQGRWIEWDEDMGGSLTGKPSAVFTGAKARSTDQNDELGRVRWIMSDKTGTLTANEMKMIEAVVHGESYKNVMEGSLMNALVRSNVEQSRFLSEYLFCLSVCHTVTIGEIITEEEVAEKKKSPWKHLFIKVSKGVSKVFNTKSSVLMVGEDEEAPKPQILQKDKEDGPPPALEMQEYRSGKWKDLIYKGSSPDEEAFVKFTNKNGFVFSRRIREEVEVTVEIDPNHPDTHTFTILHCLEYTNTRARMSVICKDDKDGNIVVYSKGADSAIMPLLDQNLTPKDIMKKTTNKIDALAARGLRTLVVARRTLDPEFFEDWFERMRRSATGEDGTAVDDRKKVQTELYKEIECDLELLGVTAVEDRLQDNVADCIAFFLAAGIRFMMITGDKMGTAENIAKSTKLITADMTLVHLSDAKNIQEADTLLQEAERKVKSAAAPRLAVVIDGATLKYLLKVGNLPARFYRLMFKAAAIVCCRCNPRIKAKIVALVRSYNDKDITLAIGDGGNDVSMIQKAHIGVGIMGRDGTQASRSSDYAIYEFQHLRKLVAVHGRWNFLRNSTIVQYWVYKNVAFIFVLFWFGIHSGWSGQNFYDAAIITLYNVFFTAFPPVFFALMEQDATPEMIYRYPLLYKESQKAKNFTPWTFGFWVVEAFYVSLICYFIPYIMFDDSTVEFYWAGDAVAIAAITVVNLRMLLETRNHTWFIHLSYWISFALLVLTLGIESVWLDFTPTQFGVFNQVLGSGLFWMLYPFVVVISLLPAVIVKAILSIYYPWDSQIAREMNKVKGNRSHLSTAPSTSHLVARQKKPDPHDFN